MFFFTAPFWLIAVIPVVVLFVYWLFWFRGHGIVWSFKIWHVKNYYTGPKWPIVLYRMALGLFWLAILCIIIALAHPQKLTKRKVYSVAGSSLMIVLDVSPSMAVRDSGDKRRIDLALFSLKKFLTSRSNDLIGIITMGKEAGLKSPLTQDYIFLNSMLDNIEVMEQGDGTSLGTGLALAALHLQQSRSEQKNIILITDGDNNSGEIHPDIAVNILKNLGIHTYVMGLGKSGSHTVMIKDPISGRSLQGIIKDAYNESILTNIAIQTGGQFFHADTSISFDSVFQILDGKDISDHRFKLMIQKHSYQNILYILASLCIGLALFIRFIMLQEAV
jgi:Ca-activated chloride channel family protein